MFKNRIIIFVPLMLFIAACVFIFTRANSSAGLGPTSTGRPVDPDEPIAFIGHGAMFDLQGNVLEPSPQFLQEAQAYYLNKLSDLATSEQRAQLQTKQANVLAGANLNARDQLIANSALIDWFIDEVQLSSAGEFQGKNNFIKSEIRNLYQGDDEYLLDRSSELNNLLDSQGLLRLPTPDGATRTEREAYLNECAAAGVPNPPDWGDAKWQKTGDLSLQELFIELEGENRNHYPDAEAYVYKSASPAGVCMALPRQNDKIIGLLGIICMGQESSNACFWDNQKEDGEPFVIDRNATVPITNFAGGAELYEGSGGTCTDCHAGENPFAIHPGTALDPYKFWAGKPQDIQLFQPANWHKPKVHSEWPQNPGPSNPLDGINSQGSCAGCHVQNGSNGAGRYPDTKALPNYCAVVLQNSIYEPKRTMPPAGFEGPDYSAHTNALLGACPQPLGPMATSTIEVIKDGATCSARNQTLKYTVKIISKDNQDIKFEDRIENVLVSGKFENLILAPGSVKLALGAGVTGPDLPTIANNTFTWKGDFDKGAQITLEYTARFDENLSEGSLGTNTVLIEDGIATVVLSKSEKAPKPPAPPGPPAPPPNLGNLVYLPLTQWTIEGCDPPEPPPPAEYFVTITDIGLENGGYVVDYETSGYTEQLPGQHVHFYFNTVAETDAGVPGKGPWILYGGPRPFTQYGEADRPANASAMCARVANPDHSIIHGSGSCFPLP